jgi:hypothetical protein
LDLCVQAVLRIGRYTFKDLQRELKTRGLRASGKKQELKDRLKAALAQELAEATMKVEESNGVTASKQVVTLAAVEEPISTSEANTVPVIFSLLTNTHVDNKAKATQSSARGVQPGRLADLKFKEQNVKQEAQQLACERERKERVLAKKKCEAEDSVRRVVAIKRCEDAEKHRQHEAELGHLIGSDAPNTAPDMTSPMSTHKIPLSKMAITKALEPKRLTPGPNDNKHAKKSKPEPKPFSPMDTYEISDREESTDDEEDNEERRRKHMPAWASGASLREALRAQANSDPSAVFAVSASSCDLKNIFKTDRVFKKRTSSQNWGMDLSTQMERQKYRTEMGFTPPK